MGNWIPNDPTLVAQILKISSSYAPPPPAGFVSPMTWGNEEEVTARFTAAGVPQEQIAFAKETFVLSFVGTPQEFVAAFRHYYGPTMNAFDGAQQAGRADELQSALEQLFESQNTSTDQNSTAIPATYLRVTVTVN